MSCGNRVVEEVMKEPLNEKNVLKNLRATDWAVIVVSMSINTTKISRILKFLLIDWRIFHYFSWPVRFILLKKICTINQRAVGKNYSFATSTTPSTSQLWSYCSQQPYSKSAFQMFEEKEQLASSGSVSNTIRLGNMATIYFTQLESLN